MARQLDERDGVGAHLQSQLCDREDHEDRDLERGHFLLRQPARSRLRNHARQHALVGALRSPADCLDHGAHDPIRAAGLEIS